MDDEKNLYDMNFLEAVAHEIVRLHASQLEDIQVVVPNKRSSVFFQKYLSRELKRPTILPYIQDIERWIHDKSEWLVLDEISLILELYQSYKWVLKSNESLDEFYFWGKVLLQDFNDIDRSLVSAEDIFKNIEDIKEIDTIFDYLTDAQKEIISNFWHHTIDARGEERDRFLHIWKHLLGVYKHFHKRLISQSYAYSGMVYKHVMERLESEPELHTRKTYFIGFNALSKSEERIFTILQKRGLACFFWDYDTYYLSEPFEAGMFMRKNLPKFAPEDLPLCQFSEFESTSAKKSNIHIIPVSSNVGQVKVANKLLQTFSEVTSTFDKTAVVLADEDLLFPVLKSMPSNIDTLNVTMGVSLDKSTTYGLIKNFLVAQRRQLVKDGVPCFFYQDIVHIFQSPLWKELEDEKQIEGIVTKKRLYIPVEELSQTMTHPSFFRSISPSETLTYLKEIVSFISEKIIHTTEYHFTCKLYTALNQLEGILSGTEEELSFSLYEALLYNVMKLHQVNIEGDPLTGLQVMGLLETRNLDFENVIVLSCNEGFLPSGKRGNSFIPFNIRKGYGLNTFEQNDAIYGYYFYRLIQRAKRVFLLYDSRSGDGLRVGEKSRFLTQLAYEIPHRVSHLHISEKIEGNTSLILEKEKRPEVMAKLDKLADKKFFSPSAINTYLDCTLKYYYKYIAEIEEPKVVEDTVDAVVFGNIYHKVMEELYTPYEDKWLNKDTLIKVQNNTKEIEQVITEVFRTYFPYLKTIQGEFFIVYQILLQYVIQTIEYDKRIAPFKVVGLEKKLYATLALSDRQVTIGGEIDRIDQIGDTIYISDYKTGKAEFKFQDIPSLFLRNNTNRKKEVFQILLYVLVYKENYNVEELSMRGGVYVLKDIFNPSFHRTILQNGTESDLKPLIPEYLRLLQETLEELFDHTVPFSPSTNLNVCRTCSYKELCHRD